MSDGAPGDPKRLVAAGYDAMAQRYLEWSGLRPSAVRLHYLQRAVDLIPLGADVLELGCGAGIPMTRALAAERRVTGVDISAVQVELARRNVPAATILQADMTTLELPPASFDAVVAFYSLTHVPRDEQPELLRRIRGWLRPGGVFLGSMGADSSPDEVEDDWLGVPMFFSHFGARRNRRLVEEAGLDVEEAKIRIEPEDRHDARFLWIVARAPRA
ncbi:MAG: class I SAM-dependent methyltransferase [Chloroflexota bacterium]